MSKSKALKFLDSLSDTEYTVGMMVRLYRRRWGFTLQQVQELTGISKSHLSAIENDRVDLGIKRAGLLASAFLVHPQNILFPNGAWEKSKEHEKIEKRSKKLSSAS